LSLVGAVDEVDNVAITNAESDIGYSERAIACVKIASDRESTVEDGGIGVGDGNIDRVGITRGEVPVNDVGSELNPKVSWAGDGDGECQRRGSKSDGSEGFDEHF